MLYAELLKTTNNKEHNQLVFYLNSYSLIANDIVKYKIAPSNLRDYLKYNYPKATVIIKDD